jgi:hypothetical protein
MWGKGMLTALHIRLYLLGFLQANNGLGRALLCLGIGGGIFSIPEILLYPQTTP